MALEPGQYQIGSFVFGEKTLFRVENFDPGGYDVNVEDFQVQSSDEIRFGQDTLKPLPIQITINAFINRELRNISILSPPTESLDFSNDPTVGAFAQVWRDEDTRHAWGALKPLYVCREDASVVILFGRPGKLQVSKRPIYGLYHKIVAEFRRSDTFAYNKDEWDLTCTPLEIVTAERSLAYGMGDCTTWVRFIIVGPAQHPIIQFADLQIDLDVDISSGEEVEINACPWSRRVVNSEGINYASRLNSPFLDQIKFPPESAIEISWNATGTDGNSLLHTIWRDAWNVP